MFKNYKESLFHDKIILRSQQRFRIDHHRIHTEEVKKIALSSNDDKRIQIFDKIATYSYGTNIFNICENEMLLKNKFGNRLNNEAQVPKNNSQVIKNELHELMNEAQALINNSQVLTNNSHVLRNKAQIPKNKSQIDNKESDNKFTNNMRSMIDLLINSVNKTSEINQKIARIDNKESDNKFTDNMRSVIDSLLKSVNKISEINQKIVQIDKVTTYLYRINTFKVCESEMI